MDPTIRNLGFNPVMRSEDIQRYSGVYQAKPESLAVHICDTSMMAYLVGLQLNSFGEDLNLGKILEKALLHDLDEVITGDIPRNTKYASKGIKSELDTLKDRALDMVGIYLDNWYIVDKCKKAKEDKEGFIISLVDMLGVLRRAIIEVELLGNKLFLKVVEELRTHLRNFYDKEELMIFTQTSRCWIIDLINDSINEAGQLHRKYQQVIDDYMIEEVILK